MRPRNWWTGEDDAYVQLALRLLWDLEPDARLALDPDDVVVVDDLVGCIGCVGGQPKKVFIDRRSRFYRLAAVGDVAGLIVLLHHEAHHYAFGPDERLAYAASIEFLQRTGLLSLRSDIVAEVEGARDQALAKMNASAAFHDGTTSG